MEEEKKYLSVKEFANLAGVSTQRIYQMLGKDLQNFCKSFGKCKKVNINALEIFGKSLQAESSKDGSSNSLVINALIEQIEIKDKQLAKKDEQIFELQSIIKSIQEQQISLTKSLANSQALHAGTIKEHIDSFQIESESNTQKKKSLFSWIFNRGQNKL